MAKWKQSAEFVNETQPAAEQPTEVPPMEEQPMEEGPPPKRRFALFGGKFTMYHICIIFVIAVAVCAFVWAWQKHASENVMQNPGGNPADSIVQGGGGDSAIGSDPDALLGGFEPVFVYTAEEKELLRAWGYTGDEIESEQLKSTPAEDLVEASKKAQEEAREALANPESPEYQALLNQTWLGELPVDVPVYNPETSEVGTTTLTLNADFEKMPAHGSNLFLRVELEDGSHHFMEVSPYRYSQLPDSGNIVVTYDYLLLDGKHFINNMREKQVE